MTEERDPNLHRGSALLPLGVHGLHASATPLPLPRPRHVVCVVATLLFAEFYTEFTEFSHPTLNSA